MTPRNLFTIILKIFGLFFLREIIIAVPQFFSTFLFFTKADTFTEGFVLFVGTAIILAFYIFLVFQLLFKANFFVDKLKLTQGFDQQEFSFNISTNSILRIALIVIGGLLLVEEIPNFVKNLFSVLQLKMIGQSDLKTEYSYLIITTVKIIIGLLIIGERKWILEFIEKRQKKNAVE